MANDGIKIVHREETFNDHAVGELADARAQCICRLQFGRCTRNECKSCPHHAHFMSCYDNMNDYDKMRTDSKTAQYYGRYSLDFESFMSYKQVKSFNMKIMLFLVFCIALLIGLCMMGNAVEYKRVITQEDKLNAPEPKIKAKHQDVSMETTINVRRILRIVQETVYDLDDDGWVNCVDHAVLFKIVWDKYFEPKDCIIVRNRNPRVGMLHLFVAVFDYKLCKYIDVEPWAHDLNVWQMADRWGNAYDVWYNIYGEDERWLGEVRRRIR